MPAARFSKPAARPDMVAAAEDAERVRRLHAILYQHSQTPQELTDAQAFLAVASEAQRAQAWTQYAQVLLMANEFLFAD